MKKYNLPDVKEIIEKQDSIKETVINPKTDLHKFKDLYDSLEVEYTIIENNHCPFTMRIVGLIIFEKIIGATHIYFDKNEKFEYQEFFD